MEKKIFGSAITIWFKVASGIGQIWMLLVVTLMEILVKFALIWLWISNPLGPPGGNDCAAFSISSGKWAPNDCSVSKPFVCEIQSSTNTISTPICPSGYSYFDQTNFCYKVNFMKTWFSSFLVCNLLAGSAIV